MSGAVPTAFAACAAENRAALIPYVMAGDPMLDATPRLLEAIAAGGADLIELGIPYSDPLADGPTIQAAARRALDAKTTFDGVLDMVRGLDRTAVPVPLIAFTYYNPVFVRGVTKTAADLARAGFAGAIVPDLAPEEADDACAAFEAAGVPLTFLVAPTTAAARLPAIARRSSGFVYVVSRMGVTGAVAALERSSEDVVGALRALTAKPLAVGFGVSTPAHAKAIAAYADGVVVGSALIDRVAASGDMPRAARDLCAELAAAVRR